MPINVTSLTPREIEVFLCLADGMTYKGVARKLNISLSTVKKHIGSVILKLDAKNSVHALKNLYELGVFTTQDTHADFLPFNGELQDINIP